MPEGVKHREANPDWDAQGIADEARKEEVIVARLRDQGPPFKHAREKGLKIAMGTDQSHRLLTGENLVELAYMVEFLGMTPMEAIQAATINAARLLKRDNEFGALVVGRSADLIAVAGNPLENVRTLENVGFVMKQGEVFKDELSGSASR